MMARNPSYGAEPGTGGGAGSGQRQDPFRDFQQGGFRRAGRQGGSQWEYQSNVNPEELFKTIFGEFSRARGGQRGFGNPFDEIFRQKRVVQVPVPAGVADGQTLGQPFSLRWLNGI